MTYVSARRVLLSGDLKPEDAMRLSLRYLLVVTASSPRVPEHTVSTAPARCPPQEPCYQLDPSGDPIARRGILLAWTTCGARTWRATDLLARQHEWFLPAARETTSNTFHDNACRTCSTT